jgi:hypothetical protein
MEDEISFLKEGRRVLADSGIMVRIFYNDTTTAPGKLLDVAAPYTNPMTIEQFQVLIEN